MNYNGFLGILLFGLSSTAFAANLVINGEFNSDLSNWSPGVIGTATATWRGDTGSPTTGALQLVTPNSNEIAGAFQRIALSNINSIDFVFRTSPGSIGKLNFEIRFFSEPTCSGFQLNYYGAINNDAVMTSINNDWVEWAMRDKPISPLAKCVQLLFDLPFVGTASATIDHVQMGPSGTLDEIIFVDGFESP